MTLDDDVAALLERYRTEHGMSAKQAINALLRQGLTGPTGQPFRTRTASMGRPRINLDRASQLIGELEDQEIVRKMALGK